MKYKVTGTLESWYDPNRPVFSHEDTKLLGKRRKIAPDKVVVVTSESSTVAEELAKVFTGLNFKDVAIEEVSE